MITLNLMNYAPRVTLETKGREGVATWEDDRTMLPPSSSSFGRRRSVVTNVVRAERVCQLSSGQLVVAHVVVSIATSLFVSYHPRHHHPCRPHPLLCHRCHRSPATLVTVATNIIFFKHKYITQPTLTPVDTVVKAIDDLTCALKGTRNTHGMQQIERLKMIDKLRNKIPSNLKDMSDPFNESNISKGGRHQTRTNTTNLSIPSSKHRRHTKTNIGASSKGAKRK